jgi:hypothetical protein
MPYAPFGEILNAAPNRTDGQKSPVKLHPIRENGVLFRRQSVALIADTFA